MIEAGIISAGVAFTSDVIATLSPDLIIKAIATFVRLRATGVGIAS